MKQILRYILFIASILPCLANAQEEAAEEYDIFADIVDSTYSEDAIVEISDINGSHIYAIAEIGLTNHKDFTYGLTLSYMQQWGGYISAHVNKFDLTKCDSKILIDSRGYANNGQKAFLSGESKIDRLSLVGGITYIVLPKLIAYLGGGYGYRRLLYETRDGAWIKEKEHSAEGYEIDFGIIGNFNNLLVKVGGNTIKFKGTEFRAGIGYRF